MVAFVSGGLLHGQDVDLDGLWKVVRTPAVRPPSSPLEGWLQALPGAVFTLSPSVIPPLGMIRKDLGHLYAPSSPTTTISDGMPSSPSSDYWMRAWLQTLRWMPDMPKALGFVQGQVGRRFEGELAASGGCWVHLSLEESEDGSTLSGMAQVNMKISRRGCFSLLAKGTKKGEPFPYRLMRLR